MSRRINKIFTKVSSHYDLMNHLFSLGIDKNWRGETVARSIEALSKIDHPTILDLATGTGDLAIMLSKKLDKLGKKYKLIAMDFNKEMLDLGKKKAVLAGSNKISFEISDAMKTGYPNNYFDLVISGFALRNLDDLEVFSLELKRILKRNGKFIFVDMAVPDERSKAFFFRIYSFLMRIIGFFVDRKAYSWLVLSILKFNKKRLIKILSSSGFKEIKYIELKMGVAYIVSGRK